jgi:hypothetical protein
MGRPVSSAGALSGVAGVDDLLGHVAQLDVAPLAQVAESVKGLLLGELVPLASGSPRPADLPVGDQRTLQLFGVGSGGGQVVSGNR